MSSGLIAFFALLFILLMPLIALLALVVVEYRDGIHVADETEDEDLARSKRFEDLLKRGGIR